VNGSQLFGSFHWKFSGINRIPEKVVPFSRWKLPNGKFTDLSHFYLAWAALNNIISHTLFQLSMNRVLCTRLLFMTLIIICKSEIHAICTSLAIQCMQVCAQGCYKNTNTDFKQNNTPFVLSISQQSSEGRIAPPTLTKFVWAKTLLP